MAPEVNHYLFFFKDTATTEIYTLSLHDALPISTEFRVMRAAGRLSTQYAHVGTIPVGGGPISVAVRDGRTVSTRNILTDTRLWLAPTRRSDIEREGFKATAAAPLAVKDRILGALVVHYWTERTFGN